MLSGQRNMNMNMWSGVDHTGRGVAFDDASWLEPDTGIEWVWPDPQMNITFVWQPKGRREESATQEAGVLIVIPIVVAVVVMIERLQEWALPRWLAKAWTCRQRAERALARRALGPRRRHAILSA